MGHSSGLEHGQHGSTCLCNKGPEKCWCVCVCVCKTERIGILCECMHKRMHSLVQVGGLKKADILLNKALVLTAQGWARVCVVCLLCLFSVSAHSLYRYIRVGGGEGHKYYQSINSPNANTRGRILTDATRVLDLVSCWRFLQQGTAIRWASSSYWWSVGNKGKESLYGVSQN